MVVVRCGPEQLHPFLFSLQNRKQLQPKMINADHAIVASIKYAESQLSMRICREVVITLPTVRQLK